MKFLKLITLVSIFAMTTVLSAFAEDKSKTSKEQDRELYRMIEIIDRVAEYKKDPKLWEEYFQTIIVPYGIETGIDTIFFDGSSPATLAIAKALNKKPGEVKFFRLGYDGKRNKKDKKDITGINPALIVSSKDQNKKKGKKNSTVETKMTSKEDQKKVDLIRTEAVKSLGYDPRDHRSAPLR